MHCQQRRHHQQNRLGNFFFGACAAQCQMLSQRMAEVQQLTAGMDDVLLVSITVDPQSDTPE